MHDQDPAPPGGRAGSPGRTIPGSPWWAPGPEAPTVLGPEAAWYRDWAPPPPPPPAPPPPPPRLRAIWIAAALIALLAATGVAAVVLASHPGSPMGAVASDVDPAVVDIDNHLAGGTGLAEGTGMLISSSGLVLTNNHVIAGAANLTVQVDGRGPRHAARVVGDDPARDVAVVQVQGVSGLPTVSFGDSSKLSGGDLVYVIGNALGRGGTPAIHSGTVAALGRRITATDPTGSTEELTGMIEVHALIQSGDSGGPLVDESGHIVGMDTAGAMSKAAMNGSASRIGFAIPIDAALPIASQIEAGHPGGGVEIGPGPLIGVEVQNASGMPSSPVASGAYVAGVQPSTPAASAGIVPGDVITAVGGRGVAGVGSLSDMLRSLHPGQRVTLEWVDNAGAPHSATLTLAAGPPA